MAKVEVDVSGLREFAEKAKSAGNGALHREMELWVESLGWKLIEIVQNQIIAFGAVDTRNLLHGFEKGSEEGVWTTSDGGLTLEIGTKVKYARWVNDGHFTNPSGVTYRFVPGYVKGGKFHYDPSVDGGIMLRQQYVKGKPYWDNAIHILETAFPGYLEKKMQEWLDKYFD